MGGDTIEKKDCEHISENLSSPADSDKCFESETQYHDPSLPPVDGGLHAWLFLTACFMLEAITWGFSFSYGVFQDYYRNHEPFKYSQNIAVIGTCAMGLAYLLSPIVIAFMIAFPRTQRWVSTAGLLLLSVSLALGSFSSNITHLILSQGVAYGIGGCLAYTPSIIFMHEWFDKKKGFAYGVVWGGSGMTGVIFPIILQALLNSYGWQTTLRISSVALFLMGCPFLFFHRPRLPRPQSSTLKQLNLTFFWDPVYIVYQLGNIIEALGFFLPNIFLPSHARSLGASNLLASLTVVLFNLTSVFGCASMGYLSDRYHIANCILISNVGAVVSVFLIWGLSNGIAPLYIFAIIYGLFAGGFSATWSGISHEVKKSKPSADLSMVFGLLETGRGIGNVLSGPLSEALLRGKVWEGQAWGGYGSGYGVLVVFTGLTAFA
ncbi:hypothetical protein MW887_003384 [Aspergillus wentii]|nr:hypothetical protein MW887_003384 [Aspergillus wentii]